MAHEVAVAVLAAGRGIRLGLERPKALLPFRGRPLVVHALSAARASGLAPVIVVVGYGGDEVEMALDAEALVPNSAIDGDSPVRLDRETEGISAVTVLRNPGWAEGISSSLRRVLTALEDRGEVGAVCVGLADQPLVGAEAYRKLARAFVEGGTPFAVATYGGVRSNPVLLARSVWSDACSLRGDVGARALMNRHAVKEVPCDGTGKPWDIDTMEDLQDLSSR